MITACYLEIPANIKYSWIREHRITHHAAKNELKVQAFDPIYRTVVIPCIIKLIRTGVYYAPCDI